MKSHHMSCDECPIRSNTNIVQTPAKILHIHQREGERTALDSRSFYSRIAEVLCGMV